MLPEGNKAAIRRPESRTRLSDAGGRLRQIEVLSHSCGSPKPVHQATRSALALAVACR